MDEAVKNERLAGLQQLLRAQQDGFLHAQLGTMTDILFEGGGKLSGQIMGRSPFMHPVHVEAPDRLVGSVQPVHIQECFANSLRGDVQTVSTPPSTEPPEPTTEGVYA